MDGPAYGVRIVGGTPVSTSRKYPFLVSLQTRSGSHFCGAALIGASWLLTAAHCTAGGVAPGQVQVGVHTLDDNGDECVQTRTVTRVLNHEVYNGETLEDDIALLRLSEARAAAAAPLGRDSRGVRCA